MEVIDLTTETEVPKPKTRTKAKAKANTIEAPEQTTMVETAPKAKSKPRAKAKPIDAPEQTPIAEEAPKPKSKSRAKPKEKHVAIEFPPAHEEPPALVSINTQEPLEEEIELPVEPAINRPETTEVATTTRKPKGHRPKLENKEELTKKVNCQKCDKKVSLHSIKYTHKKFCNKNDTTSASSPDSDTYKIKETIERFEEKEIEKPQPTVRQKMDDKRKITAQRLLAQCFKS